jgi:hypothetical protein
MFLLERAAGLVEYWSGLGRGRKRELKSSGNGSMEETIPYLFSPPEIEVEALV